jgi:transcriptional regulator with XRE-family HTH domain
MQHKFSNMALHKLIKIKMTEKGFSEVYLANHLGISNSFISRVINGKCKMPKKHIKKICELFDIDETQFGMHNLVDEIRIKFGSSKHFDSAIAVIFSEIKNKS